MTKQALNGLVRFEPVKVLNSTMTLFKAYIMALGKNRNHSHIGKAATDAALPSLYNVPVIGHVYKGDDDKLHMGGHDSVIKKHAGSLPTIESICVPYGVVPFQDNAHYEEVEDPDGVTRTYLCADVILWTGRWPELLEAKDTGEDSNVWFNQSMEINVYEAAPLEEDKTYTDITQFEYSALCLLGRSDDDAYNVEPCFHEARVEAYTLSEQFDLLFNEMKQELAKCYQQEENHEGGNVMPDETPTADQLTGGVATGEEQVTPNEAPATFQEDPAPAGDPAPQDEGAQDPPASDGAPSADEPSARDQFMLQYAVSYKNIADKLDTAIHCEDVYDASDRWIGWYSRCVIDFSADKVIYREYHYDAITEEQTVKFLRRSFSIADETAPVELGDDIEVVVCQWLSQAEIDSLNAAKMELEELRAFKVNVEESARREAIDAAIAEFADMAGNEAYDAVYENRYSYATIEALKDACYLIRGKYSCLAPKPSVNKEPVIPVESKREEKRSVFAILNDIYGNK